MTKDVQTVIINADNDGDNLVITLPGKKPSESITLVGYMLSINAAGTVTIRTVDNTVGFELTNPGASYPGTCEVPAYRFPIGHNIEINCSAGADANGHFSYFVE